ncbi:hypothetical protein CROQUDRAFT_667808 [Cronartium quercuum f. sp. fusiforme G11]|uniref:Oligopeptide transporter n=1 Tax=Cronartium quercuum f. sp. fusiforme G11 TaxID=708437 RepID=A0A9P6TI65_9BASI|nr:hypothetical protein CROQUDRAFT_667808 [Cronartium quercuum f. sp. fusiforme G11]
MSPKTSIGSHSPASSRSTEVESQDSDFLSEKNTFVSSLKPKRRPKYEGSYSTNTEPFSEGNETSGEDGASQIPLEDDSHMPCMTVRALLTGFFVSSTAAVIQQLFLFKPSHSQVQPLFLQLACLFIGRGLENIPGPTWWNPGPYSIKENSLSSIMATAAAVGTLAVEMIAAEELFERRPFHYGTAMAIMLSSQLIGYGFAGLLRRPLVYYKHAAFPAVLPSVALFHSFHDHSEVVDQQLKLFKRSFLGIAIFELFPQYIAPTLQGISPFCMRWQHSEAVTRYFGGILAQEGLGIFSISLDWNLVGALGPLYTPFSAQVNEWAGILLSFLFLAIGYEQSWFSGGKENGFPFLNSQLLTHEGKVYNQSAIINEDGSGNWDKIKELGTPYFSSSFILANIATNLAVGAAITHCLLWGWGSISGAFMFRRKMKAEDIDPHWHVCQKYAEVPVWAYLAILCFSTSVAFLAASLTASGLSARALAMALVLAAILTVAAAFLRATTGAMLEVEPAIQMIGGLVYPNESFGNAWFTTYGSATVSQSISMLQDLKLGQYMHLPPISVFTVQLLGTLSGVIFNYMIMSIVVNTNRELLLMEHGSHVFTGVVLEDFQTQAVSWGIFARRLFTVGERYVAVPASLGVGLLLPIPAYIIHRIWPRLGFRLINIPLVFGSFAYTINRANAGVAMAVIAGFLSQFYARRYHPHWFYRSNYILSAALDGGAQVTAVLLGFMVEGGAGWKRLEFPQLSL